MLLWSAYVHQIGLEYDAKFYKQGHIQEHVLIGLEIEIVQSAWSLNSCYRRCQRLCISHRSAGINSTPLRTTYNNLPGYHLLHMPHSVAPAAAGFPHMSQAFDMLDILVPAALGTGGMLTTEAKA